MRIFHLSMATALFGVLLAAAAAQTAPFDEARLVDQGRLPAAGSPAAAWSDEAGRPSRADGARCGSPDCKEAKDAGKRHDEAGREAMREVCPMPRLAGPLELASRLGAFEAFVGIRASQLDAWRNYTDALQAMPVGPESERRDDADATATASDLLAQSAALAGDATAEDANAARLLASVEALSRTLSDEQKVRLAEAGPLLPAKCSGTLAGAGSNSSGRGPMKDREQH